MDTNEVFNAGGIQIPNPNYSKSKKNKEPQFITVSDLNSAIPTSNPLVDTFYDADKAGNMIAGQEYKDVEKYLNYGINPYKGESNIDSQLEDAQSNWKKGVNALGQAVSEIVLGTGIGIADVVDFAATKIFDAGTDDYQNPISNYLTDLKEKFKNDVAPIYVDPKKNIDNGGLLDMSWWLKGVPDVASTIAMLLPSKLTLTTLTLPTKVDKVQKIGSKLKKFALSVDDINNANYINKLKLSLNNPLTQETIKYGGEKISNGLLMRTMENYQEARDVNIDTYTHSLKYFNSLSDNAFNEWLANNENLLSKDLKVKDRNSVAKDIAKQAADRTFAMDYTNLMFDIIQLYGLRNVGKGIKQLSAKGGGTKVQTVARQAKEDALAFAEHRTSKSIELSKKDKLKQGLKDFTHSGLPFLLEESTEGIEEAVNYIAQQEGITYGKLLTKGTAKNYKDAGYSNIFGLGTLINTWRNLQNPLNDYLKNAELHESAFWGFMGGLAFGGIHSASNKASLYFERKAELERQKERNITTNGNKENQPSMMDLLLSPEEYAATTAISMQQANLEALNNDLRQINDGIDIYSQLDEHGAHQKFSGDENTINLKKELAIAQRQAEYISDLTTNAINSGTFNILKDYFTSDEMKKAFIELGVIKEEDANSYVANVSNLMDKYKKMYNEQIAQVNSQVIALNAENKFEDNIPLEYVRLLAKQNYDKALQVDGINAKINALNQDIAELEQTDAITRANINTIDAKEAVNLTTLINLYGQYQAQKRSLEENKDMDVLMKTRMLADIERQKTDIVNELKKTTYTVGDTNVPAGIAAVYQAFKIGNTFKQDKGNFTIDKNLYKKTDEEIIDDVNSLFEENERLDNDIILNQAKQLEKKLKTIISPEGKSKLAEVSADLANKYQALSILTAQKHIIENTIATSKKDILEEVDFMHNRYSEMRQKAIDKASEIVSELYVKYKGAEDKNHNIEQTIIEMYKSNKQKAREYALKAMSKEDADNLISALDIFSFSSKTANAMYDNLNLILATIRNHNMTHSSDTDTEIGNNDNSTSNTTNSQNSTNSNQAISDNNTDNLINSSAQTNNVNNSQENGQNSQISNQTIQPQSNNRPQTKIKYKINDNDIEVTAYHNPDDSYELDVKSLSKDIQVGFAKENYLNTNDVDFLNQEKEWTVTNNPVLINVNGDYKLATPGDIEYITNNGDTNQSQPTSTTDEGQTSVDSSSPVGRVDNDSTSPVDNTINNTQDDVTATQQTSSQQTTTSPTGVVESNPDTSVPTTNNLDNDTLFAINEGLTVLFGNHIADISDTSINFDEVADVVFNEAKEFLKDKGITDDKLKELIDNKKQEYIELNKEFSQIDNDVNKAAANLGFSAKCEEFNFEDGFSDFFTNAITKFMDKYKEVIILPEIDGKQLVRLKDVLYICDNCLGEGNGNTASQIYQIIVNYLNSDEGKVKYIVEDINEGENIINKLYTDKQLVLDEKLENLVEERVNISEFISNYEMTNNQEALNVFNSIEVGDELDIKLASDETHPHFIISKNGTAIGSLPVPSIDSATGAYHQVNNGWVVNITKQGIKTICPAKDVFIELFTSQGKEYDALRSIIAKYQLDDNNLHSDVNKNLALDFANNPVIKNLAAFSINHLKDNTNIFFVNKETKEIDYQRILDHLARVWRYTNKDVNTSSLDTNLKSVISNVNNWFDNLYNTYTRLNMMRDFGSDTQKVTVTKINEGQIINVTNNILKDYNELSYSNEAFADNVTAALSYSSEGKMIISGKPSLDTSFKHGSTVVSVFSRNAQPSYVNAIGVKLEDIISSQNKAPILNNLVRASMAELNKALEQGIKENNKDLIINTLKSIITHQNPSDNRIPLFNLIANGVPEISSKDDAIKISIPIGDRKYKNIRIYTKSKFNNRESGNVETWVNDANGNISDKQTAYIGNVINGFDKITQEKARHLFVNTLFETLKAYGNFNVSKFGIQADNTKSTDLTGFIKYVDGKLKIDIDGDSNSNFHNEFDSYNDFVIKNNLIKVNTKIVNNSNFTRRGDKQVQNQTLFIALPIAKSKTNNVNIIEYIQSNSNKEEFERAKDLIENDTEHIGKSLLELALGNEALNRFNTLAIQLDAIDDILPKAISYDGNINFYLEDDKYEGPLAYTRGGKLTRTKYISYNANHTQVKRTIPEDRPIIIGSRLLNMLASSRKREREEAIRKLIHENIHYKLSQNPNKMIILNELKSIYNEYKKHLKEALKDDSKSELEKKELNALVNALKGYKRERLLEEFLAESLTNKTFVKFLNNIKVEGETEKGKDNLFTKIFKVICELFGIKAKDNSLMMKELNTLRNILNPDNTINTQSLINDSVQSDNTINNNVTNDANNSSTEDLDDDLTIEATDNLDDSNNAEDNTNAPNNAKDPIDFNSVFGESNQNEEIDNGIDWDSDDFDDLGNEAQSEEFTDVNNDINDFIDVSNNNNSVINLETEIQTLPFELQKNYTNFVKNGFIEVKCGI